MTKGLRRQVILGERPPIVHYKFRSFGDILGVDMVESECRVVAHRRLPVRVAVLESYEDAYQNVFFDEMIIEKHYGHLAEMVFAPCWFVLKIMQHVTPEESLRGYFWDGRALYDLAYDLRTDFNTHGEPMVHTSNVVPNYTVYGLPPDPFEED